MLESVVLGLEGSLLNIIVFIAEVKFEKEYGRMPVGYYKARRKYIGAIRQDQTLKMIAETYINEVET